MDSSDVEWSHSKPFDSTWASSSQPASPTLRQPALLELFAVTNSYAPLYQQQPSSFIQYPWYGLRKSSGMDDPALDTSLEAGAGGRYEVSVCRRHGGPAAGRFAVKHFKLLEKRSDAMLIKLATQELKILLLPNIMESPNIVSLLGWGWDTAGADILAFSVLEYAEHRTLGEYLRNENTSVTMKAQLCLDVTMGLSALHRESVVHGDLKADNVLIFEDEAGVVAKISDFDHAVILDGYAHSVPRGTPLYNSPEAHLTTGQPVSTEELYLSDIYSLGLLIWEVFLNGAKYFRLEWLESNDENIIDFLVRKRGGNWILAKALDFAEIWDLEDPSRQAVRTVLTSVFVATLQDIPAKRSVIGEIMKILTNSSLTVCPPSVQPTLRKLPIIRSGLMTMFSQYHSSMILRPPPWAVQQQILAELDEVYDKGTEAERYKSGLQLAACYFYGFGAEFNIGKINEWLVKASEKVCHRGKRLCKRLSFAVQSRDHGDGMHHIPNATLSVETEPFSTFIFESYKLKREDEISSFSFGCPNCGSISAVQGNPSNHQSCSPPCTAPVHFRQLQIFGHSNDFVQCTTTLLHYAAYSSKTTILDRLLNAEPAKVNHTDLQGFTPLHYACLAGDVVGVTTLLDYGSDPAFPNPQNGVTSLHLLPFLPAASIEPLALRFVGGGAKLDAKGQWTLDSDFLQFNGSPLHWAVQAGNVNAVKILVRLGTDATLESDILCTPVRLAISLNEHAISQILLRSMTSVQIEQFQGFLPLINSLSGEGRSITRLIRHGARRTEAFSDTLTEVLRYESIDATSQHMLDGHTALTMAVLLHSSEDDIDMVDILIRRGANARVLNTYNKTLLATAAKPLRNKHQNSSCLVQKLISEGLDVDAKDDGGNSALHLAVTDDSLTLAYNLLRNGADPNCKNPLNGPDGTLLYYAASAGSVEMVELLLQHGADINSGTSNGGTPLRGAIAVSRPNINVIHTLLRYDASLMSFDPRPGEEVIEWNILHAAAEVAETRHSSQVFATLLHYERVREIVNSYDSVGFTPLHRASMNLNFHAIGHLLNNKADIACQIRSHGFETMPLYLALRAGRHPPRRVWKMGTEAVEKYQSHATKIVEFLHQGMLKQGVDDGFFKGKLPRLHISAFMGDVKAVKTILANGEDPEVQSGSKNTAFGFLMDTLALPCIAEPLLPTDDWAVPFRRRADQVVILLFQDIE